MSATRILTAAQMRWADEATIRDGVSSFRLMDRAGAAVAAAVLEHMPDYGRVVIVTGSGNNGGDGFAAAHYLKKHRIPVTIVSLAPLSGLGGDVKAHAERAAESGAKIREACSDHCLEELGRWLTRAVVVVDAIFGTGLSRPVEGMMASVIECLNRIDRPVLSIDIPSGICSDTGSVLGAAVKADMTLPIAASKWGHWLNEGRDYTGKLLAVADIGIEDSAVRGAWKDSCDCEDEEECFCVNSTRLIDNEIFPYGWPGRPRLSHKGDFGHVWIFGGSKGFTGAAQLAGLGAYAAGSGLASIACPDETWPVIASANVEVMAHPESTADWSGADALVIGPGWGTGRGALLTSILESDKPAVIDADALNIIAGSEELQAKLTGREAMTVITPHPGEAARLLGKTAAEVQADRKHAILELINRFECWVVLKGSETLIASPERDLFLNPFGSPQLAVAGSGDVLSGMIAAQLAHASLGGKLGTLVSSAVALHGKAGERRGWYLAGELAGVVADLRQQIEQDGKLK